MATQSRTRRARPRSAARADRVPRTTSAAPIGPRTPFELDSVARLWQLALDSELRALHAAAHWLPSAEVSRRTRDLVEERKSAATSLARLAETTHVRPAPWLSAVPVTNSMLGLPPSAIACLFDLDGVLTDSGALHASAWAAVFNEFLQSVAERNGWHFIPFDPVDDYLAYIDGRPRLEGVHAFLDSRGIRLPEGRMDDSPDMETACGLARRKRDVLSRGLHDRGVTAVHGARRYLEASGHAGLRRAVVSASAKTESMLELAGLATLLEGRVDADLIQVHQLRSRPAPDILLVACEGLDVRPSDAVTFTHSPAGVAAGLAAGMTVIGVGDAARRDLLQGYGADVVVPSLSALLNRQLLARP
jgi:beta-phosphoglucomutase-like phosphatase (HAD superfamily)